MRKSFLGLGIGALMASAGLASMAAAFEFAHLKTLRRRIDFHNVGPRTRKTGRKYPHCGARQEARYRRQIAAGQLTYAGAKIPLS